MNFLAIIVYLLGKILIITLPVLLQFPLLTLLEPYKSMRKRNVFFKSNLSWFTNCMEKHRNDEMVDWGKIIYPDLCQGTYLILGTWFSPIRSSDSPLSSWLVDLFLKIFSSLTESAFGSRCLLLETLLNYFTPFQILFLVHSIFV